jgi:adenylate kinase
MKCYAFIGIQGSGKGTQAEQISDLLDYQHINIGDLFREQVKNHTPLGEKVGEIIGRGELVTDELVFEIIKNSVKQDTPGIIFDGFPRTIAQAEYLIRHYNLIKVFYLDLSEQEAIERISARRVCRDCHENYNLITQAPSKPDICDNCGGKLVIRQDDQPEAIHKRFQEFMTQTMPLKQYFSDLNLLKVIPADKTIREVFEQLKQEISTD